MAEIKKDALGNPVLYGQKYGYSMDSNGLLYVTTGKAIKATAKGVTLEVIDVKRALYDDDLEPYQVERKKVNVKSGKLFPIK